MFRSTHDFETKIFREICTLLARLLPRLRRIAVRAKNACCVRSVRRGENFVSGAFVESVSVQIYYNCNLLYGGLVFKNGLGPSHAAQDSPRVASSHAQEGC